MVFTLGGYNSFLRNNKKNILYPYDTYTDHWVLGFVYKRLDHFMDYDLDDLPTAGQITCPYEVEAVFLREKYELCGLRAGAGNTKNIGSFKGLLPSDFKTVLGPFSRFTQGKSACDHFWSNYELYAPVIKNENDLLEHKDFAEYL